MKHMDMAKAQQTFKLDQILGFNRSARLNRDI